MQQEPALNYARRLRVAAWFHHGGKTIPELASEFRTNCSTIGEATREFAPYQTTHVYQQMVGGR